jgi:hypothetical protein
MRASFGNLLSKYNRRFVPQHERKDVMAIRRRRARGHCDPLNPEAC